MSTLDYAFRAKNIRNKPQIHAIPKKTLLKDLTNEIERLKSELISTRQRVGVYLSNETYEDIVATSESRRIAIEEQSAKMETLESNIRNKAQELFPLLSSFTALKKDYKASKIQVDQIKDALNQTESILSTTRKTLAGELCLREAHAKTEAKLADIGGELLSKLHQATNHIQGLDTKSKRMLGLQSINQAAWRGSQSQVADVTTVVMERVQAAREEQQKHVSSISARAETFVDQELKKLLSTQALLEEQSGQLAEFKRQLLGQKQKSKKDMDDLLDEIKVTHAAIKD
ncbi:hypothetical protein diail_3282, partial [Diaporthe ilicicola]